MLPRVYEDIDKEIDYLLGKREAPMAFGGAHEAASRFSREMATWYPAIRSPDADILPDKSLSDARALDIMRNDAFVAAGASLHKDNIVGSLYLLNAKPNTTMLGLDDKWAEEFQEEVESKFTTWAESPFNWIDAARRNTLTSFIRMVVGVYLHSGEVLFTSEWLRPNRGPFRTAFQMIELSRLSDPASMLYPLDRTRGGIEFDTNGAPVAYYIRRASPGDYQWGTESWNWSRVRGTNSWGRPMVFHVMEQQRPGQSRGISQLVAALKEMRTTKRFRDITLQNAVINASFAAAIESEMPTQQVFEALGSGNVTDSIMEYATAYLGAVNEYADGARNMHIDGAKIPHFFPGTKLNLTPMGTPGGIGTEFESSLLRYIAANLDVSYEELSRDFSKTNYSSARAGMLSTYKASQARKKMVSDRVATLMYGNWLEEAIGEGEIEAMKTRRAPSFYDRLMRDAYINCDWIGASRGMIDELKETQAAIQRLQHGLSTWEDELGRQGKDWRAVFAQLQREKKMMTDMGIEPQSTAADNALSGQDGGKEEEREAG